MPTLLVLALLAAAAHAGPPQHNFLSTLTGSATPAGDFDKACGTAVDSAGNVYVASAGNDAIEVFSPTQTYLATITNANEPCGLAVDSDGDLYVSETDVLATGTSRVVRYTPTAYPLPPSPSWSDPEPIDSSGQAKGIGVDPTDDRLYVARGDHVAAYNPAGTIGIDEVQRVFIRADGGSYTLSFQDEPTAPIDFDASPAQIEAALEALSTIGPGDVSVSRVSQNPPFTVSDVTFVGALGATDVEQLVGDPSGLTATSGSPSANVETQTQGFDGRIGDGGDLTDATGVAAYTSGSGDRYLFAADAASDQVKVFADPSIPASGQADIRDLQLAHTIDGSAGGDLAADATPDGSLGFGAAGAYLGVDQANGHVLVYDDAHSVVDEFEATGTFVTQMDRPEFADAEPTGIAVYPHRDEVQRLTINASGGTFTLAFEGDPTGPLPHNATAAQVQAALEALPAIGAGNVFVSGGFHPIFGLRPHRIQLTGALGKRNLSPIVADGSALTGTAPTATITTLIEGSGPGRVYVTAGSGSGARLLAFAPFAPASRSPLPALSSPQTNAQAAAVDSQGNFYVSAGSFVRVFSPAGALLTTIDNGNFPTDLAVDGAGNLYVMEVHGNPADARVVLYRPSVYPFGASPSYGPPETVVEVGDGSLTGVRGIGVNPANGHLFVGDLQGNLVELDSAANGSGIVNGAFGAGLLGPVKDVAVYGRTGEVYVAEQFQVRVLNPTGTRLLRKIDGSGAAGGNLLIESIDIDQTNGHVVTSQANTRGVLQEFEASGAFVAQIGGFPVNGPGGGIALDNSGGPNQGNLYLAYIDDLKAFGPLSYGEVPAVVTGTATGIGAGNATLNGTVDPRGFPVSDCHFEYTDEQDFTLPLPTSVPCAESLDEIGSGTGPVAVHADVSGLDPQGRYSFRLVAENEFGTGRGELRPFGPPLVSARRASGVHYTEAVLNARLDPSGLATTYRFEYGSQGPCDANPCSSTPERTLAADAAAGDVKAPVVGLQQGTTYHFRLVAENAAGSDAGADGGFTTLSRPVEQSCPNAGLRTGPSANLPDCRAYELVTLADLGGNRPYAAVDQDVSFNNWLVTPTGPSAGNSLVYYLSGTVPGFEGTGILDGMRARRGPTGWTSALFGPTYAQAAGDDSNLHSAPGPNGVDPTHDYSAWQLDQDQYLRTPAGFEPLGQGSLGTEPDARVDFVTSGASHVVFSSDDRLEPAAPPAGTMAVYDRSPGGPTRVVSLLEGDATPGAGQHAAYQGISEDGSAIAFKIADTLYVRRGGATVEVAEAPNTFAGLSDDGERIFYAATSGGGAGTNHLPPATLHAFDLGSQPAMQIAADSIFVNVAADGSRVYFTSQQQLGDAPPPADLSDKLYLWDGSSTRFVAALVPEDLDNFNPGTPVNLAMWAEAVAPNPGTTAAAMGPGRAVAPSRATGDGRLLLFQSHGDLTGQNPGGLSQVYRYDGADGAVVCVSCPPGGEPAAAKASLQNPNLPDGGLQPAIETTLIPNLTVGGQVAFFETSDALLPEDTNGKLDVYQWRAAGSGGCTRSGGCQALISTGRAVSHSFLYSMTADGSDVFFTTAEKLVAADEPSSISIYDARVGGGFAEGHQEPCVEDACQSPAGAPAAPTVASVTFVGAGNGAALRKVRVLKKSFRGAVLGLNVKVPGAGVLAAGGRNLKRVRKRVGEAGSYKLIVRLTKKSRRALRRDKRLKLTVRVRFTPTVGEGSQATVSLIAKPAKQGRRADGRRVRGERGGGR